MNIEQLNSAAPEIPTEAPAGITSETLNSLVETYCRAIATREDLYAEYMKGTTRAEQIADAIRDFLAKHGLNEEMQRTLAMGRCEEIPF